MRKEILIISILIAICFPSCSKHKRREDAVRIVAEWTGKEIKFPENVPCYVLGKDTLPELCGDCFHKEYKILLYVDSMGCSSCRLQLFEWKQLIEEADNLFHGEIGFLLFYQPKSVKIMGNLFTQDRFDYPVFMDVEGTINQLNQFPEDMQYQCFLLDSDNKVLMVGNPVTNIKIWELYKSHIAGRKETETNLITSITIDKEEHDYGTIQKGCTNLADFSITNTGNNPLVITRITTSCGCVNVTYEKQPIEAGKTTTIHVELTPDEEGILRKIIIVYTNTNDSPIKITLFGTIIE